MTVYLVGAGPGDPGLLTVRGREVLERADVVIFDRLSVSSLLGIAPPAAERINVGKQPGSHPVAQSEINDLLVLHGRAGRTVVRLKGGDPFVFARGGEEAAALAAAGIEFEVVPGISSAIAVPAYAGIPVTQRHSSTSFTVVTGHEEPGKESEVDWDAVARVGGTILILMGAARIGVIAEKLIAGGRSPETPVAAIRWGTRPEQHTIRTTLSEIAAAPLEPPSVIVVGAVAALDLAWFEHRPLHGRRVAITRLAEHAGALRSGLEAVGAHVIEVPLMEVIDPADGGAALSRSVVTAPSFDWVVFTSRTTVSRWFDHARDARSIGSARVAVIGPGTADALRAKGIEADLIPQRFVAEGLLEAMGSPSAAGSRVLIPQAAAARPVLADGLRQRGWDVTVVEAYRTTARTLAPDELARLAAAEVITFASASAVGAAVSSMGVADLPPVVVCIGPVVAAACARYGVDVSAVAEPHTVSGLCEAVVRVLGPTMPG